MSWIKKEAAKHSFRVTYLDENNVILPEKKDVQVPEEVWAESKNQKSLQPVIDWIEETQGVAVSYVEGNL